MKKNISDGTEWVIAIVVFVYLAAFLIALRLAIYGGIAYGVFRIGRYVFMGY
jgi:hypothetical protein